MEDIMNPLRALAEKGQAVWLDYLSRDNSADRNAAMFTAVLSDHEKSLATN